MSLPKKRISLPFAAAGLLLSAMLACGPVSTPEPPAAPTEPPEAPVVESGAVTSLDDAKRAIIQIQAEGSFVDPEFGLQLNAAGRGSGFIIDQSGIAVTNNHVVTGAALLKVWVGGESQPRNARILGVSECSDLAVIDIEGDGYPFLEWYDGPIRVGTDVFAAGFPLGDPEYTLTRGIVSKERAAGDTNWASIDSVLEHDATINPGNSGGPLVTTDGKVIGVNFAGDSGTNQYFAISRDEALRIIEQMRAGQDVDSIGVNGEAVNDGSGLSGIWVASVKSGSPADSAGVRGGDIITRLEGLVLATDGTMADYCDILRSHRPGDTLSIEVLRFATEEVLEGQLNGRTLEASFSFARTLGGEVAHSAGSAAYTDYVYVSDDYGAIQMEVPAAWSDVNGSPWVDGDDVIGSAITASRNIDNYQGTWTEPGVFFGASDELARLAGYVQLLDVTREDFSGACQLDGRYDYEDALYEGKYDLWAGCGGTDTVFLVLSAVPKDNRTAFLILVQVQIVGDADLDALDRILNSFQVVGDLPSSTGGSASAARVTLVNNSSSSVCFVNISPSANDSWGDDWLGGEEIVAVGASRIFEVATGQAYDFRASDCNGDALDEVYNVTISAGDDLSWEVGN